MGHYFTEKLRVGEIITFPNRPLGNHPSGTHGILILSGVRVKFYLYYTTAMSLLNNLPESHILQ